MRELRWRDEEVETERSVGRADNIRESGNGSKRRERSGVLAVAEARV